MKNYNTPLVPSLVAKFARKATFGCYYASEFAIPNPKLGVDYYGNLEDSLYNVFRVDAVALVDSGCNMTSIMCIHTPDGVKHNLCFNSTTAERYLNYFESKEDFMEYAMNGSVSNRMPYITLKEFLGDALETYSNEVYGYQGNKFDIYGFVWKNEKVEKEKVFFDLAWRDKNGVHVVFNNSLYTTREECFKDHFQIIDGTFPEDKPKVKTYNVSVQIEISAESETEAQQIALKKVAYITE